MTVLKMDARALIASHMGMNAALRLVENHCFASCINPLLSDLAPPFQDFTNAVAKAFN